jgi:hypothetical protein
VSARNVCVIGAAAAHSHVLVGLSGEQEERVVVADRRSVVLLAMHVVRKQQDPGHLQSVT